MIKVSVYKHPDEFPDDVNQLFAAGAQTNVESSVAWYNNLVNAVYPGDVAICIYVLRKNNIPLAALPMRVTRSAFGQQAGSLSNYYTALYAPVTSSALTASDMTELIRAIKSAHTPLAAMRFAPMAPESADYGLLLQALRACGFKAFTFFRFGNWYQPVIDDWQTYLKNREGTVRSTIKRMGKKFANEGGSLELVQGGENLERGLAAYQHVYALSWKQPEPYPEFVPGLIRTCAAHSWLRLGVAWLNGKPIAAQLWIVANGKANIYKLAYDESFKAYAPGTLLTAMLMEHVIEQDKVREVDYLIGDDPYKKSWMSKRRERWGIIAYNPRSMAGLLGLMHEVLGRAAKHLKSKISKLSTVHALPKEQDAI